MTPIRIALIGSRGIPARYGGYETFAEQISPRLVARGFSVTVYCRSRYTPRDLRSYLGASLVVLPTIPTKHLDTPVHSLLSAFHAAFRRYDAILVVNAANAAFLPILRIGGGSTALHVDGIERERAKWGVLGRAVYSLSERLAVRLPQVLVTDAQVIHDYYFEKYRKTSTVITYGVDPQPEAPGETLERLGLEPGEYFLYVSRFEPENNPHRVAEAYRRVGGRMPLVMVGDAPYADQFIESFTAGADSRTLFPGSIYGSGYRELLTNAYAYIQATEVGGTHPALVEAMGYGNCLIVNDTPENREVAADAGVYFDAHSPSSLAQALESVRQSPEKAAELGRMASVRATEHYSWEAVADRYAEMFRDMAGG